MSEELRPCPFCGKSAQVSKEYEGYIFCECIDDDGSVYDDDWNSAWCWKEIDRLKEDVETWKNNWKEVVNKSIPLENEIEILKARLSTRSASDATMEAQNDKMRKASEFMNRYEIIQDYKPS